MPNGQYTNEEYKAICEFFTGQLKSQNIFHWQNNPEKVNEFDGLLFRGDRNPNTKGLQAAMGAVGAKGRWEELQSGLASRKIKTVLVAGPENQATFPDIQEKVTLLSQAENLIWLTAGHNEALDQSGAETWQIPLKTYLEKAGSFTNHQGKVQAFKLGTTIVDKALTLSEAAEIFAGRNLVLKLRTRGLSGPKVNYSTGERGAL